MVCVCCPSLSSVFSPDNQTVYISTFSAGDGGLYQCRADNQLGSALSNPVQVSMIVDILLPNKSSHLIYLLFLLLFIIIFIHYYYFVLDCYFIYGIL